MKQQTTQEDKEKWRSIEGYEGLYLVSNMGKIKSVKPYTKGGIYSGKQRRETILKTGINGSGYFVVSLYKKLVKKTFILHRVVALTFIPNPENKPQVNHKNGNKLDNRVENLEWNTISENQKHSFRIGIRKPSITMAGRSGEKSPTSKRVNQFDKEGKLVASFVSAKEAGQKMKLDNSQISAACRSIGKKTAGGYIWKYAAILTQIENNH